MLLYDDDTATVWYHIVTTLSYVWPLVFAIVADSGLGKTKAISFGLAVYVTGMVMVALGGMPQERIKLFRIQLNSKITKFLFLTKITKSYF